MIDEIDARVRSWVEGVAGDVPISMEPPGPDRQGSGVGLYLLSLQPQPSMRGGGEPAPVQIGLRYLVTAWSDDPGDAHRLLGQLVVAGLRDPELEVDLEPLPADAWAAFRLPPQPSFVLVTVLRDQQAVPVKLVRGPLQLKASDIAPLSGTVVGPNDVPLAAATVELPALQLGAVTDWRGRFAFAAVPREPRVKHLVVRARGRELAVDADLGAGAPLMIRFAPLEG